MRTATDVVRRAMREDRVSGRELARRLGVTESCVSQMLRFDSNMTVSTLTRVARVLGRDLRISLPRRSA